MQDRFPALHTAQLVTISHCIFGDGRGRVAALVRTPLATTTPSSSTGGSTRNGGTRPSSPETAAVGELKAKPRGELQVHGTGKLARSLLENHLVDEIILLTYPAILGQGTRLFPDTGPDTAYL